MNGNALFDLAEIRAEQEREAAIAEATLRMAQPGSIDCEDCGEEIAETRRRALPSARRCYSCQERFEQRTRKSR